MRPLAWCFILAATACVPHTIGVGPRPASAADSGVRSGPVQVHVVYPGPTDIVQSSDSTFLFGSVRRGDATLTVKGAPVPVLGNGAWIAWVALPDDSAADFQLVALVPGDTQAVVLHARLAPRFRPPGPTGLWEPVATLAVALKARTLLQRAGATVPLTRTDSTPIDLYPRTHFAEQHDAAVLVSIHANALPDGVNPFTNNGTSVYYFQPRSADLARALDRSLVRELGLRDLGKAIGEKCIGCVAGSFAGSRGRQDHEDDEVAAHQAGR